MGYETILLDRKDNIGIIKLNYAQKRNALGSQLISELISGLQGLEGDPEVHVVVLMSNVPGVFCAGRDLSEGSSTEPSDIIRQREFSGRAVQLWSTLRSLRKVVICAVNGYALAAGFGLTVCCDLVIAAENATFGLPEIHVGLFPTTVGPAMVRNIGSLKKCFELFLTGDRFSAEEAERMAIINKVVPADKLEDPALELAGKIASKSPTITGMGKEFFYTMLDMEYSKAMQYGKELLSIMAVSEDGREGQRAFVEKRTPQWRKLTSPLES
jgi:enoyl-CoA hydratase/carnithine racemase